MISFAFPEVRDDDEGDDYEFPAGGVDAAYANVTIRNHVNYHDQYTVETYGTSLLDLMRICHDM